MTRAFLPEVSASRRRSGRQEVNSAAVSEAPVSTTASTSGWVTRRRPASSSSVRSTWSRRGGAPASARASATAPSATSAQRTTWGAGLTIAAAPAARAARAPPTVMATGKFHGGVTATTPAGVKDAPATSSSARARVA